MKKLDLIGLAAAMFSACLWFLTRWVHEVARCLRRAAHFTCGAGSEGILQKSECCDFPSNACGVELAACNAQLEAVAPVFRTWFAFLFVAVCWAGILWIRGIMEGPALMRTWVKRRGEPRSTEPQQEAGPWEKIRFVGLDVHSRSIAIAVAEANGLAPENLATIPTDTAALLKHLKKLGPLKNLRVCYEAGPTGFGLCRDLKAKGVDCIVDAPSLVPVQHGDRVKTDRRDAVKLARFLRSGDLTSIYVPEPETEAMRDLERARDDAKNAQRGRRHTWSGFENSNSSNKPSNASSSII
jgi:hypothetical protein